MLAAVFAVAAIAALQKDHYQLLAAGSLHVPGLVLLLTLIATLPLAARRIYPLASFWVMLAATPGIRDNMTLVIYIAVIFAGYSAVVHSKYRGPALLAVPLAGGIVLGAVPGAAPPMPARAMPFLVLVPIAVIGDAMRRWQQRAGKSQARIGRLQAEHEEATQRALELERARLASEMHDVVTHNVSVMVVQAGAARQVLADAPDEARKALLAVEANGRAAMTELRQLLALLTPDGEPGTGGPADPAAAQDASALRPQPGLSQLDSLIDRVSAAGLPVRLQVSGVPRDLPPGADLAAYRVVQEALTNVLKHAGQARTDVRLDYRDRELIVEIADGGQPSGASGSGPGAGPGPGAAPSSGPGTPACPGPGTGHGLPGLRQRLALHGGELEAGWRPGGGWRVRARIPRGGLAGAGLPARDAAAGEPAATPASGPATAGTCEA